MDIQRRTTAKQTTIKLSGDLTIYEAASAKSLSLENHKGLDRKVLLNLQQVEELDTSGVQLLLMLQRLVQQQGGELETVEVSESAGSILQLLRCQAALNLKEIDP